MYGGSEFDGGAAAFMGGGFMPSQATQPHDSFASSSSSKNRDSKVLLPLTVKQMSELPTTDESNFTIDGVVVNTVVLVGRVCRKEDKVSDYTLLVDDGTGVMECCKWFQEPLDTEEAEGISIGTYVRVHGHLRGLQGRRFINVFSIRPVTDFNEVVSHLIECIYVHFYNTKMKGVAAQPPPLTNSIPPSSSNFSRGLQSASLNQPTAAFQGSDRINNLRQKILDVIHQPQHLNNEEGVHRDVIARQLNLPMHIIKEAIEALVVEGDLYSTIDDDHFKSAING
ncbi:unnamed protein product [Linum tenue]|uniref:Replication protein A C-terminal domain-containing protein n=1 Tax=Linum tenue TaxID=586396 RepID=A0AAV0L340_9ROSI|nr:unnamed protein product [Linum tenue]